MYDTIYYKGEALGRVYPALGADGERESYGVYKRESAINGKWFLFRRDGELIGVCQYRRAAVRTADELNELARGKTWWI